MSAAAERIFMSMKMLMLRDEEKRSAARRPHRARATGSAITATDPSPASQHSHDRWGTATHFQPDPDGPFAPIPARTPVTPFIEFVIDGTEPFEIDGDLYHVETVWKSGRGCQADILILRGHEYMRCPQRNSRRAIQVRYLEELVHQGRVEIPFHGCARQWNLDRGWCRGSRTLASLGITL